jgi:hypothetical protein
LSAPRGAEQEVKIMKKVTLVNEFHNSDSKVIPRADGTISLSIDPYTDDIVTVPSGWVSS